jgi:hypothetical protein
MGVVKRPWGEWAVALLWNPSTDKQAITLNFGDAGLDPRREYAVWSFWDDRFLGFATKSWTTPSLAAGGCQHLCLTPIELESAAPVVIGSNLHIYCGAAEIDSVAQPAGKIIIKLTDAGARDGDLWIYSRLKLAAVSTIGCTCNPPKQTDKSVWMVHIADRQIGRGQTIELAQVNQ